MTVNRKPTGRALPLPAGLLWGLLWSIVLSIAGALITGKLVDSEVLPEKGIGYGAMVTLLVSSFAGAKCAVGKVKRLRIQVGLASGVIYLLTLLAATALFFGGQYSAVGVTALLIFGGSMLASLPERERRGGKPARKYKIHT